MKNNLLICFFTALIGTSSFAQTTLRRTDFAVSGTILDSARYKDMTLSGLIFPTFGDNQIWDYTGLKDASSAISTYYFTPVTAFGTPPVIFSNATLARNSALRISSFSIPLIGYQLLDTTGYYSLGYATLGSKFSLQSITLNAADSLIFPAASYPYLSKRNYLKFPITANSAWKSDYKATVDFQLSVAALSLNKVSGQRVTTVSVRDTIVGWGTLKMRNPSGGAALNFAVLLRRTNETQIDSFFLANAPAPTTVLNSLGLIQGATSIAPTIYNFAGMGFNEPQLYMEANANGIINYTSRAVLPSLGLTTDNREVTDFTVATKVYPNPSNTEGVTFAFDKTTAANWHIMVYNTSGQIVTVKHVTEPQGATTIHLALDPILSSGVYFYNLLDETSLIRAQGKFLLQH